MTPALVRSLACATSRLAIRPRAPPAPLRSLSAAARPLDNIASTLQRSFHSSPGALNSRVLAHRTEQADRWSSLQWPRTAVKDGQSPAKGQQGIPGLQGAMRAGVRADTIPHAHTGSRCISKSRTAKSSPSRPTRETTLSTSRGSTTWTSRVRPSSFYREMEPRREADDKRNRTAACEKSVACSTCHVILEEDVYDKLEEPDDDENVRVHCQEGIAWGGQC